MTVIVRAVQTSAACPAQWDAWDAEGRYYYLRYRHGVGYVQHWPGGPNFWERPGEQPELIAHFEYGNEYDGSMSLGEFVSHAKISLGPDLSETSYAQLFNQQLKAAFAEAGNCDTSQLGEEGTPPHPGEKL